jgi:hypothetical protein
MLAYLENKEASFTQTPITYPTLFTGGDSSGAKVNIFNQQGQNEPYADGGAAARLGPPAE